MDALLARVARESVTFSDLQRFREVDRVLTCAGIVKREAALPELVRPLLDVYIEEELMYLEARAKKIPVLGLMQAAVKSIHASEPCRTEWQSLGGKFGAFWKTPSRPREGESQLVRELEKRVLVEKFRKGEFGTDTELWKREVRARYPVKVYVE